MTLRGPGSVPPWPGRCGIGGGLPVCALARLAAVKRPPAAVAESMVRREMGSMIESPWLLGNVGSIAGFARLALRQPAGLARGPWRSLLRATACDVPWPN